jgi:hypothetical protein
LEKYMNGITMYQIMLAVIACCIIFARTMRFLKREHTQSVFKFLTFVFVWGSIAAVALFPGIAHWIRRTFGFGENFNTLIFIAFVILFSLFFRLLTIIERIENSITEIVRKEALTKVKGKTKSRIGK